MKIRNNIKLKSFKLNKIIGDETEIKNNKKILLCKHFNTNIYNSQKKNKFKINEEINSTETPESRNIKINKDFNKNNNNIINTNIKNLLLLNKINKNYLQRTFNDNFNNNCFSVPQTLNYYGRINIKSKATNAVYKMNKFLMKKNIDHLSLPKSPIDNFKNNKNKYYSYNIFNDKRIPNMKKMNFVLCNNNKYPKKKERKFLSLFEKEKVRQRERYQRILKEKFVELETCEKKFNFVIENTLLKLNEEEKNLYKL